MKNTGNLYKPVELGSGLFRITQIVNGSKHFIVQVQDENVLSKIQKQLSVYADSAANLKKLTNGAACTFRPSKDEALQRGVILKIKEEQTFVVRGVDSGLIFDVPSKFIFEIKPPLFILSSQSIAVGLHVGTSSINEEVFKTCTASKTFRCNLVKFNRKLPIVELIDNNGESAYDLIHSYQAPAIVHGESEAPAPNGIPPASASPVAGPSSQDVSAAQQHQNSPPLLPNLLERDAVVMDGKNGCNQVCLPQLLARPVEHPATPSHQPGELLDRDSSRSETLLPSLLERDAVMMEIERDLDWSASCDVLPSTSSSVAARNSMLYSVADQQIGDSQDHDGCSRFSSKRRSSEPDTNMVEDDSTIGGDLLNALNLDSMEVKASVFSNYSFDPPVRKPLKIEERKTDILDQLKKGNAVVIKGFNGCGKTSQVPQFILDESYKTRTPCNIVVTQPSPIAAISIAKRVCEERKWKLGTVVGYQVGMERQTQPFTCLTYMTTGCLLESLTGKKSLQGYTHIILDEVHERDEDTDLLLLVVRKFLRDSPNGVKVIVMSATANADKFSQYFRTAVEGNFRNAPIIEVDEIPLPYDVREYYLNDLQKLPFLKLPHYKGDFESIEPTVAESLYEPTALLISCLDEYREKPRCGIHSVYKHLSNGRGSVLVFLPGMEEIESMHKFLQDFDSKAIHKNFWHIVPLHARITSEEQNRVFESISSLHPQFGHYRKIILSTNIAESSLTVPDIVYVIDFCLVKQFVTDPDTKVSSLKTEWAAKSSCIQRKGRVGRVDKGVVYRMITQDCYHNHLREDVTPEILRCPLERAVLRVKLLDMGEEPQALLALLIDPPSLNSIARAILTLKEIGALFITVSGKLTPLDGDLTFLGRAIARLPVDVRLGKLVILGYVFNILEECIIMAAGLSSNNIITFPCKDNSEGSFSDPITILNAYQKFKNLEHAEYYQQSGRWENDNFIQVKAMKEMDHLAYEIKHRLVIEGLEEQNGFKVKTLTDDLKALLLRVVIFGAFYPNHFTRDASVAGRIDERVLIAANIGTRLYDNCAMARSITLLPNIAGFPTILTLLFAPRVEFRTDAKRTRLVGAICGLGYDRTNNNQPLYDEHDVEISFDTEIDISDVYQINKARFWMDSVLGVKSYGSPNAGPSKQRMLEMNQKTLNSLLELIAKPRKGAKEIVVKGSYKWNRIRKEHVIYSDVPDSQLNTLIPLHDVVKLFPYNS